MAAFDGRALGSRGVSDLEHHPMAMLVFSDWLRRLGHPINVREIYAANVFFSIKSLGVEIGNLLKFKTRIFPEHRGG